MYEIIVNVGGGKTFEALLTEEALNDFRNALEDESESRFIEFYREENGATVAIDRSKIAMYEYKPVSE